MPIKDTYRYNMPVTLEKHFENLAQGYPAVQELYSLWTLLKKQIEEKLIYSSGVFVNYSHHDKKHCLSIIQSIERFLGEERICRLSATDTFMLLVCVYSHDYGMAQTYNRVYDILGSEKFRKFVDEMEKDRQSLEKEDEAAVHNLFSYLNGGGKDIPLKDLYFSIMLAVQLYLRPTHWEGVADIRSDFYGLFQGTLKKRYIYGLEGIVEICMCHGQSIKDLFKMSYCADGMAGDEYHPRFVASMLRLGDLLDLDNGRFPIWFMDEIARNKNIIPKLSVLHFRKHESVSHLLVTPEKIEITAHCYSAQVPLVEGENKQKAEFEKEKARQDSYDVAALIHDWTEQLAQECQEMVLSWSNIAQPDFGYPPTGLDIKIYVDGKIYMAENRPLQMKMSQERVMKLLEGTNIYKDRYVGLREMIQNAVDASLLQFWLDLSQNRYSSCGLSKKDAMPDFDLWTLLDAEKASVFKNYDITLEVIEDKLRDQVIVVVKDKGIGISLEDVGYIADIGSSKEKNARVRKLTEKMPAWLKPSGIFGIGLQSVFQLTDCIEFYTRQHNQPERQILLYSYGRNRGKIETRIVSESGSEIYYDNAIPGTNVKIVIAPHKLFGNREDGEENNFLYCDPEFDTGEELHKIFEEISKACRAKIEECEYDYFNIYYDAITIEKDGSKKEKSTKELLRRSYISPSDKGSKAFGAHLRSFDGLDKDHPYIFQDDKAFFWDKEANRCYTLFLRDCGAEFKKGSSFVALPPKDRSLYNISYKFNRISNVEELYGESEELGHRHAGFLKLDVLILDDKPMDYMNIDRDRLRAGAVNEDELLEVREKIVQRWCRYLCAREDARQKEAGALDGAKEKSLKDRLKMTTLVSLILTFYRNVPSDEFDWFMDLLGCPEDMWDKVFLANGNKNLEKNARKISALWDKKNLFQTELSRPLPHRYRSKANSHREEEEIWADQEVLRIHKENVCRLPHRLIKIEAIRQVSDKLFYYLHIQTFDMEVRPVEMDDGARLNDYIYAFDLRSESELDWDMQSLQKKVFKPDSRYKELLVSCYPHTFTKGRNMQSELDYCIKWYILSPFGPGSAAMLEKMFAARGADMEKEISALIEAVQQEDHFRNCVSYVLKKRYGDQEGMQERIIDGYSAFIRRFCLLLSDAPASSSCIPSNCAL